MKLTKSRLQEIINEELLALIELDLAQGLKRGAQSAQKAAQKALGQAGNVLKKASSRTQPPHVDPKIVHLAQQLASAAGGIDKAVLILKSLVHSG